jgi:ATP-dependent helicase HrpB
LRVHSRLALPRHKRYVGFSAFAKVRLFKEVTVAKTRPALPIDAVLPELVDALRRHGRAVLQAPPGAGKTTRVPLAMYEAGLVTGRIVMLEPRRLAARAAAERLAEQLGDTVGGIVGYRMRGDTKVSKDTRIEVVTEGILTRMLQSDPELTGVGAVVFDEFHERSLNADLGLALAWEVRGALRPDLMILVMSATLEAGPVAALLDDAPVVTSQGRSYPVETKWLDAPAKGRLEAECADLVERAVRETQGGVLVFLPGQGEIRRVQSLLEARLPKDCAVRPLYGAMPFKDQRATIAPVTSGRKVVLATSIAETSLTIEDIRVVVDAGRARRARFDPSSGMSRLVTERVTRAEATQRAGRAGRVAEGVSYRLWTKGEEGGMFAFPPAEIEAADLSGLALELAAWGASEEGLAFLTPPPAGALAEARALLGALGVLEAGRMTAHGEAVATLPLHPRLAHMLVTAGKGAARLAALLSGRDPYDGRAIDLGLRMRALNEGRGREVLVEAKRIARLVPEGPAMSLAEMAALAYPDRIGLRRAGEAPRYILSGGKGAVIDSGDGLAGQRLIVAVDLDGDAREARVRMGAAIAQSEIRGLFGDRITWVDVCKWSRRERRVVTRQREMLGAVVLEDRAWTEADSEAVAVAMLDGVRELGLRIGGKAALFRARVELVRAGGDGLPDMTDAGLMNTLEDWLLPHLGGVRSFEDWKRFDPVVALKSMLNWDQQTRVDREAPAKYVTPMGRGAQVDYSGEAPAIEVRLQEMFGLNVHPTVGGVPLIVTLLSPAGRPLQVTRDLPGFWTSSYDDVRKDMRGRYPRHPWPEDPAQAAPTLRAKPRGT